MNKRESKKRITFRDLMQGLRDKFGGDGKINMYGEASVFEALEPRVLLSATPFSVDNDDATAQMPPTDPQAVYLTTATDDAATFQQTLAATIETGAPTLDIIHDGGAQIRVGDTLTFTLVANSETSILSRSLEINGTAVTLDASNLGTFTVEGSGSYEVVGTVRDAEGRVGTQSYSFEVTAAAAATAARVAAPMSVSVQGVQNEEPASVDRAAPTIGIEFSSDRNNIELGTTVDITVTGSDNAGLFSLELIIDGERELYEEFDSSGPTTRHQIELGEHEFLRPGTYTIKAIATDKAGNTSSKTMKVTVRDQTPPVIEGFKSTISDSANPDGTVDVDLEFTITDNHEVAGARLIVDGVLYDDDPRNIMKLKRDGQPDDNTISYPIPNLSVGFHTVTLIAWDAAGNTSSETLIFEIADTSSGVDPSVTITHDAGDEDVVQFQTVKVEIKTPVPDGDDAEFELTVQFNDGTAEVISSTDYIFADSEGIRTYTYSITFNHGELEEYDGNNPLGIGKYTITATYTNQAGDSTSESIVFNALPDKEAPSFTFNLPTGLSFLDEEVVFVLDASDNSGTVYSYIDIYSDPAKEEGDYVGSAEYIPGEDGNDGKWTYTFSSESGLTAGVYYIEVIVVDDAGNAEFLETELTVYASSDSFTVKQNDDIVKGEEATFTIDVGEETTERTVQVEFQVKVGDGDWTTITKDCTVTNGKGTFTHTFSEDGAYELVYTIYDEGMYTIGDGSLTGHVYASSFDIDVRYDTSAPVIAGDYVAFSLTPDDEAAMVTWYVQVNDEDPVEHENKTGAYSTTIAFGETGSYTIKVWCVNSATNAIGKPEIISITVVEDIDADVTVQPRESGHTFIYTDDAITVKLECGETTTGMLKWEMQSQGGTWQTIVPDENGFYTFAGFETAGSYDVNFRVTELVDNAAVGASTFTLTIEVKAKPILELDELQSVYAQGTVTFTGKVTDAGKYLKSDTLFLVIEDINQQIENIVSLDLSTYPVTIPLTPDFQQDGTFSVTHTFASIGEYKVYITAEDTNASEATDNKGRVWESVSQTITVADELEVNITDNKQDGIEFYPGDSIDFELSVTDADQTNLTWVVTITGGALADPITLTPNAQGECSWRPVGPGDYEIIASVTDPETGLTGESRHEFTVRSSGTGVDFSIEAESPHYYPNDNITFNASLRNGVDFAATRWELEITSGQTTVRSPITPDTGVFSHMFKTSGNYSLKVIAYDENGNRQVSSELSLNVSRDDIAISADLIETEGFIYHGGTVKFEVTVPNDFTPTTWTLEFNIIPKYIKDSSGTTIPLFGTGEKVTDGKYTVTFTVDESCPFGENYGTLTAVAANGDKGQTGAEFYVSNADLIIDFYHRLEGEKAPIYPNDSDTIFYSYVESDCDWDSLTWKVYVDGAELPEDALSITIEEGPMVHFTYPFDASGNHKIKYVVSDDFGNMGEHEFTVYVASANVTVDSSIGTNISLEDLTAGRVTGTVQISPASEIIIDTPIWEIRVKTGDSWSEWSSITVNEDGTFTPPFDKVGEYSIQLRFTDKKGNIGEGSVLTTTVRESLDVTISYDEEREIELGKTLDFSVAVNVPQTAGDVEWVFTVKGPDGETETLEPSERLQMQRSGTLSEEYSYTFLKGYGTYTFKAVVSVGDYVYGEDTVVITIQPDLSIEDFALKNEGPFYPGSEVQFTAETLGAESLWLSIDDGDKFEPNFNEVGKFFSHSFDQPGTYVVKAFVSKGDVFIECINSLTIEVMADTVNPVVTINPMSPIPSGNQRVISGIVSDNSGRVDRVEVKVNGELVETEVTIADDGTFTLPYTFTKIGTNRIYVTVYDKTGNSTTANINVSVTQSQPDMEAPEVTLTHNFDGPAPYTIFVGNSVDFTVAVTDNSGHIDGEYTHILVTYQDQAPQRYPLENGVATISFAATGEYTIQAFAKDATGNTGSSQTITFNVRVSTDDVTPPEVGQVEITGGTYNGNVYPNSLIDFSVSAIDPNGEIESLYLYVNGVMVDDATITSEGEGRYTFSHRFAEPGNYSIQIGAFDLAGNFTMGESITVITVADTQKPVVSIPSLGTVRVNQTRAITINATDNGYPTKDLTVNVTINGAVVNAIYDSETNSFKCEDYVFNRTGVFTVTATVTDPSGNSTVAKLSVMVR